MKTTPIGTISEGIDGSDQYVLVQREDRDKLTPADAKEWLLPRVYRRSSQPGAAFCDRVSAMQVQYSDTDVICIIHNRLDI